ncbi:MAG: hypothetical protein ACRDLF_10950 [Solirubrobacteraceae bacterium]
MDAVGTAISILEKELQEENPAKKAELFKAYDKQMEKARIIGLAAKIAKATEEGAKYAIQALNCP